MARQPVPIENLEAMIHDVTDALETIQKVVRDMREAGINVVYGHAIRVENDSIPRLWKFAEDIGTQFRKAKRAADKGQSDPAIKEIARAKREMEQRKHRKNGKPK